MSVNIKKILPWWLFTSNPKLNTDDLDEDAQIIVLDDTQKPKSELSSIVGLNNYKVGFKIIILGDVGVGKTSIFHNLIDKHDSINISSTFRPESGILYHKDIVMLVNDTVGQEAFRSICQNYYREPQIVIFVYDISRLETFMNIPQWQQEVIKRNDPDYPIKYYLIANKIDLNHEKNLAGGEQFAKDNNMTFMVTSIKESNTIDKLRDDIYHYVNKNKEKGLFRMSDYLKVSKTPLFKTCCNIV